MAGGIGSASLLSAGRLYGQPTEFPKPVGAGPVADSPYSKYVVVLGPAGYSPGGEKGPNRSGLVGTPPRRRISRHAGVRSDAPRNDPDRAVRLNGSSFVEIPSRADFSVGAKGMTVAAWIRPDQLDFPCEAELPYVHWLGKGERNHFEWGFRFYKKDSIRPNRISAYIWNASGGEGAAPI